MNSANPIMIKPHVTVGQLTEAHGRGIRMNVLKKFKFVAHCITASDEEFINTININNKNKAGQHDLHDPLG